MTSTLFTALTLGILPALFWLIFFLIEDRRHPEPRKMIAGVFIAGSFSALTAAVIQLNIQDFIFEPIDIPTLSLIALLLFAFVEELVKFFAAYLVIHNHKYFDEPIDAMVYMITAAMGFAALENAVFLIAPVGEPFEMMIFRFVGATLLHALASGLLGYYWIKGKVFLGLTVATVLHLFFNILIIAYPQSPFYACGILIFASFFLFYDFDILKAYEREKACR